MIKNLITATLIATAPLMAYSGESLDWNYREEFTDTWTENPSEYQTLTYTNTYRRYTTSKTENPEEWILHATGFETDVSVRIVLDPGPTPTRAVTVQTYHEVIVVVKFENYSNINYTNIMEQVEFNSPITLEYWTGLINEEQYADWTNYTTERENNFRPVNFWGDLTEEEYTEEDMAQIGDNHPIEWNTSQYIGIYIRSEYELDIGSYLEADYNLIPYSADVVDIPGLLWQILAMPFAFISQAFNLTMFPGTPYSINVSNILFTIIGALVIIFIIRKLTH